MYPSLLLITLLLIVPGLLPLWSNESWWVRSMDFPRLQFAVLLSFLLVAQLVLLDLSELKAWWLILTVSAVLIYQLWWIIPYTPVFPVEVQKSKTKNPHNSIRIMTANVLTPNRNAEKLIGLIRDNEPDIIVTLETDQWWQDQLSAIEENYPYTIQCPLDNLYGMHVYSRYKLINSEIKFLVEKEVPSMHTLVVLPSGRKVRMHFLHPSPPFPTENEQSSERDAELVMVARSVADSDQPLIITGDFNDVAWSDTTRLFHRISGLLDPRKGRGMFNTFHADYWPIRWPLDHLFHSKHFTLLFMQRLPRFGSDHFAIMAGLCCEVECGGQMQPTATKEDRDWSDEKLQALNVDKNTVPEPEKTE